MGFHATNIVLHGLNTALVIILAFLLIAAAKNVVPREGSESGLSDRGVMMAAAVTGILFGFHPIHVESVAWISERKDVLYAFFYLAGIATYLKYVEDRPTEIIGIPFFQGRSFSPSVSLCSPYSANLWRSPFPLSCFFWTGIHSEGSSVNGFPLFFQKKSP
jgi:hypothetical protein